MSPGSAYFGEFGTIPGDPNASLLLRTVNFFAINNVFVPNNSTTIAVRYGDNNFFDSGSNFPAFDAAHPRAARQLRQPAGLQHVPCARDRRVRQATTTLGNVGPSNITHITRTANTTVSKLVGHHTLKFGGEYRRIAADVLQYGASAGTFAFTQAYTQASPTTASTTAGDAFASFLLGCRRAAASFPRRRATT